MRNQKQIGRAENNPTWHLYTSPTQARRLLSEYFTSYTTSWVQRYHSWASTMERQHFHFRIWRKLQIPKRSTISSDHMGSHCHLSFWRVSMRGSTYANKHNKYTPSRLYLRADVVDEGCYDSVPSHVTNRQLILLYVLPNNRLCLTSGSSGPTSTDQRSTLYAIIYYRTFGISHIRWDVSRLEGPSLRTPACKINCRSLWGSSDPDSSP